MEFWNGRKCKMHKCKLKIVKNQLSIDNLAQRGFTIVELMMTMFMSSIILISIYVIVSKSHEYINAAKPKIQLQQDFSLIEKLISTKIRLSLHGKHEIYNNYSDYVGAQPTQSSGTCMKLFFVSGDSVVLYQDNTDFKIMNTDSTFTTLVPGVLDSLTFTGKTNSVEITVSLSQGTWSLEDTYVATFRNYSSGVLGNRICELHIQSSKVPASLTDFPVLLTEATLPSDEMLDADGSYPALDGGGDIRFSSDEAGANRLSCEIVTFTTDNNPANGKAEIWVKVPSVSFSSNTSIWVWYNTSGASQPAANAAYGSESVWDANYVGVWHLNETVVDEQTTGTHTDATSNNNDGTQNGNDDIAGKIGTAQDFDGTDDYVDVPDNASLDITGPITIAAWDNFDSFSGDRVIVAKWDPSANQSYFFGNNTDSNELIFFVSDDGSSFSYAEVSTNAALATGTWYHVAATWNSTDGAKLYKNGTLLTMSPFGTNISAIYSGNESLKIGANEATASKFFDGRIDEARLSNNARSAAWIAASYKNQDDPAAFVIEGAPEVP